ncbi:hypothetical protein Phum_PHUM136680 [Pediculus humanus corporis]|uniref:Uncharacterized protein n=1 Tax=Pediculus humanus subsp. corporis TaxID=121224 RepID=E0VEN2_PEDHC|nr:uncharacterized protein Phum_PHUM136680 [Pediculus humanus corporis]EEB11838.1 hypothetical protein Phum_PHUM136680 [Pediculus humanus corporis]
MFVSYVRTFFLRLPVFSSVFGHQIRFTHSQKIILISVTSGIVVTALIARYLRRRKNVSLNNFKLMSGYKKSKGIKCPVDGISSKGVHRQNSVFSNLNYNEKMSAFSRNSIYDINTETLNNDLLTPQQLGLMVQSE